MNGIVAAALALSQVADLAQQQSSQSPANGTALKALNAQNPIGVLLVFNMNSGAVGMFSLLGGNPVVEMLDRSGAFTVTAGTTAGSPTNVYLSGGYVWIENRTGGAVNYRCWLLTNQITGGGAL